jgi:hypothetical protein
VPRVLGKVAFEELQPDELELGRQRAITAWSGTSMQPETANPLEALVFVLSPHLSAEPLHLTACCPVGPVAGEAAMPPSIGSAAIPRKEGERLSLSASATALLLR